MSNPTTLRNIVGLSNQPHRLSESALILIDCQNTYRQGLMQLEGVEPALEQAAKLLERARAKGTPVFHIMHDAGPGSPYDVRAEIGQIADIVAPREGEPVIVKHFPSSFEQTILHDELQKIGAKNVVLAGFMTHVCVNSTARAAFNRGYGTTVVCGATATRALPGPSGNVLPASTIHDAALASLADLFAILAPSQADIGD